MNDVTILGAIEHLTRIDNRQQLAEWADTHLLVNCGVSSALIGYTRTAPRFSMTPYFVSPAFPGTLVKTFDMDDNFLSVPLLQESRTAPRPLLRALGEGDREDMLWQAMFRQKGFETVAVAVNTEARDGTTTYLCLTDPVAAREPALKDTFLKNLSIVTPILHNVLSRMAFEESTKNKDDPMSVLTPREREILYWIRMGKTNAEISCILGVAFATIKNHVQRILLKLQVSNRTQAISKCLN